MKVEQPGIRRFVSGQAVEIKTMVAGPDPSRGLVPQWSPATFSHYGMRGMVHVILPDGSKRALEDGSFLR